MKPVIILTSVCLVAAFCLALVFDFTKEPIRKAQEARELKALASLFPFELKKENVQKAIEAGITWYETLQADGTPGGTALKLTTEKGYSGKITLMVGISTECKLFDFSILTHKETPGLGDKIVKDSFRRQFKDKSLAGVEWKVKKDGGFVDQITAATISSRAVTGAISEALQLFSKKYPGRCE